jgi:hypothetical protein
MKNRSVRLRIRIIVSLVERGAGLHGRDHVLGRDNASVHLEAIGAPGERGQLVRLDKLVRQELENIERALGHVARAGKDKHHGRERLGHADACDLAAELGHGLLRVDHTRVHVARRGAHERRRVAECQQARAETTQTVDHAAHARVLPKCNEALTTLVLGLPNALVVK